MAGLYDWFPHKWRPYQLQSFSAVAKAYNENITEQMVVQATGCGKRSQAVQISTAPPFQNKPSLFLAHREELINQAVADFEKAHSYMDVGIIKGNRFEIDKRVVVASPQTLINRLDRINPNHFGLVQIDEVHNYMAKTFLQTVRHFNHDLRIGWTATPHRLDGLSLSNLVEKIVFQYNIRDAIAEGYLCQLDAVRVKTNTELTGIKKSMGDFNQKELDLRVDTPERNRLIVNKYKEYAEGRQFIAFCVTKKHAHNLGDMFKAAGIEIAVVTSDTENRDVIDRMFREKKYVGLINVNILTEGWDYDDVGCVIDAAPTTSLTRYLQRIGRGTRLKSEEFVTKFGQKCIIMDVIDNTGKHKVINAWTLDKERKAKDKVFITNENRAKLQKAEDEREYKFKARLTNKDSRIDLLHLPEVNISGSPKMLEEATEAQIQFLINLGIYDESVEYTKALASEAIASVPAKSWQVKKLVEWGYDTTSEEVTLGHYQKVYQKLQSENKFKISDDIKVTTAKKEALEDDDLMPWGKHEGTPMKEVPAKYLLWIWEQPRSYMNNVHKYIEENLEILQKESGHN